MFENFVGNSMFEFEFLNTELWLKYTQERYVPLEDIKYRLDKLGESKKDWPQLKEKIQTYRKMGSIPFFFKSIDKKFWFYPSDSILKKIQYIETAGVNLFETISTQSVFKNEFISNASVEEAVTSAIYEGANSTRSKAKALIASCEGPKNKDEWMLINNHNAMKWIKDNAVLPVSTGLILKIHEIVSNNTLSGDDANFCGKFRNDTVYVGKHEGIPHNKINEALGEAIELTTNHPRFLHGLIKGILLHYFTAFIHPFFDGNGRTARTLFYFKSIKNDLKFVELLSVSADLKSHGKRYVKSFDLVKEHDLDVTYFIDFCLDSLVTAVGKVERKLEFLMKITALEDKDNLTRNQVSLLQRLSLNKHKVISIEEYSSDIGKSREIARRELKDLLGKELLDEIKQGKKFVYRINTSNLRAKLWGASS